MKLAVFVSQISILALFSNGIVAEACEAGTYAEPGYQECTPCLPGSFQPWKGMTNCTACPAGQTTLHSGSTSEDDCVEACEAGTYAETGYQECNPCLPGSFQPWKGMTNCTACPAGQTTLHSGSTSEDDCVGDHCDCPENTECIERDDGSYICKCLSGYMGDCDTCVDIDECATETYDCPNHGTCVNTEGSYYCICRGGFVMKGSECEDYDECHQGTDDCPDHSACINKYGSFACVCCNGYEDDRNGNCVESGNSDTTGQECCTCSGKSCKEQGEICGEDGNIYSSIKAMKISECEEQREIGLDYKGTCQDSCENVHCPKYQECVLRDGRPTCECEECSSSDTMTGPVCSTGYQLYNNLCHFHKRMCKYDMEQNVLPSNEPCEDQGELVGEWLSWGDCNVECGKGVKTRTRKAARQLFGNEVEKYRLTGTADCYEDPCPGGPCDGYDCGNDAMECVVNQNGEAECECPSCAGEGKDPVCGVDGKDMETFQSLCRFQQRACELNEPFELVYEGPCTDKPLSCERLVKLEKVTNDNNCTTQRRQILHYCDGGCGDDPEGCCLPTTYQKRFFKLWCPWGKFDVHEEVEPAGCQCKPENPEN